MLAVVVLALSAGRTGHIAKDSYLQDGADRLLAMVEIATVAVVWTP